MADKALTPILTAVASSPPALRLNSWKEIAAYLKCSPRTVRRWERQEGLPVRRHLHRKKETVYGFSDAIDAWLESRKKSQSAADGREPPTSGPSPGLAESSKDRIPSERPLLIAVLPFTNLTDNSAGNSFANVLTSEIISALGQRSPERLRVIAFTTAAHYQDSRMSIQQIGQELGVDFVVEGGVRRFGRRVRVTARLISARDQAQVWADSFEIRLPPLFTLQQGLARQLVGALFGKLCLPLRHKPARGTAHIP
jgi:TolB-like protein